MINSHTQQATFLRKPAVTAPVISFSQANIE
jgi:hypothetical protein